MPSLGIRIAEPGDDGPNTIKKVPSDQSLSLATKEPGATPSFHGRLCVSIEEWQRIFFFFFHPYLAPSDKQLLLLAPSDEQQQRREQRPSCRRCCAESKNRWNNRVEVGGAPFLSVIKRRVKTVSSNLGQTLLGNVKQKRTRSRQGLVRASREGVIAPVARGARNTIA